MNSQEFSDKLVTLEPYFFKIALMYTTDRERSKDLVQEVMTRCLENRSKWNSDKGHLRHWGGIILKNLWIDEWRKNSKYTFIDNPGLSEIERGCPESVLCAKELNELLESMNPKYGIPLKIRSYGFSYREISEQLNISEGNVKIQVHRARKDLRQKIAS